MSELDTTRHEIIEEEESKEVVPKMCKEVKEEANNKNFLCGLCNNISRTNSSKELHMKQNHNNKTISYTPSPTYRKIGFTWFSCNRCKVKKQT